MSFSVPSEFNWKKSLDSWRKIFAANLVLLPVNNYDLIRF